jgi:hypothetical protein
VCIDCCLHMGAMIVTATMNGCQGQIVSSSKLNSKRTSAATISQSSIPALRWMRTRTHSRASKRHIVMPPSTHAKTGILLGLVTAWR